MQVPQFKSVLQPLAEFVAEHRKIIDEVVLKLADKPLRFPIGDELREHIVINNRGRDGLYALWRRTARLERV